MGSQLARPLDGEPIQIADHVELLQEVELLDDPVLLEQLQAVSDGCLFDRGQVGAGPALTSDLDDDAPRRSSRASSFARSSAR